MSPTDQQLVAAILEATAHLSLRERERATGISHATFDRWRRGDWEYLQARVRARIVRYLGARGAMPPGFARALTETERRRVIELVGEMARIQAELVRILGRG